MRPESTAREAPSRRRAAPSWQRDAEHAGQEPRERPSLGARLGAVRGGQGEGEENAHAAPTFRRSSSNKPGSARDRHAGEYQIHSASFVLSLP